MCLDFLRENSRQRQLIKLKKEIKEKNNNEHKKKFENKKTKKNTQIIIRILAEKISSKKKE